MANSERRKRGIEMFNQVYCGDLPVLDEGLMPFQDLMLEQLFGEIWTREALSVRDRRLVTMGIIAALGEREPFCIQVRSALKNGELTAEQVREMLLHITQYAGYPRAAGLLGPVEQVLGELKKQE
jgi:4-carboxymuconolactone decarboxylase